MNQRETTMRIAFRDAAVKFVEKHGRQSRLVRAVTRCHDRGAGLLRGREAR